MDSKLPPPGVPSPVSSVDSQLSHALSTYHQFRWIVLLVFLTMLFAGLVVLGWLYGEEHAQVNTDHAQVVALQKALHASCSFWAPLTTLPVTIAPPATKPSEIAVTLIAGARNSYAGQCGNLPLPSDSLRRWAAYYHIPVN